MLLNAGHDWRRYDRIIKSARRNETTQAGQIQQVKDFLAAIALSAWDSAHYGEGKSVSLSTYDETKNHLINVINQIKGIPQIETTKTITKQQPKPKPKPQPKPKVTPRPLNPPAPMVYYIDPHRAGQFYAARHHDSDLGNIVI